MTQRGEILLRHIAAGIGDFGPLSQTMQSLQAERSIK